MAPTEFTRRYAASQVELPRNFLPNHPFDNGELKVRDELLAPFPRTPEVVREHIAAYYAMISEVDSNIGRVLDALERSGKADNTYIIFAADNGLAVGQHGLIGKQSLYDHSLRVPLVIAGPGIPKGKRVDGLCHLMDIGPTILDLAGLKNIRGADGRSLQPAWRGGTGREFAISAYRHFQRAIRTDRWKLIAYNVAGKRTTQLFDLREDPLEMRNLAGSQPGRVRDMTAQMQRMLTEAGDRTVLSEPSWPAF
jgi:arylsulfatase A-like enzyme